jgi:nuclear pore complex protein Nup155
LFEKRTKCYQMIFDTLVAVDRDTAQAPEMVDGQYTRSARLRSEAYDVVNTSEDEVFQNSLYDWYIQNDWSERLLEVESPYIIAYLKRKSTENPGFADLLWKYYAQRKQYYDAAAVQLELAKTDIHNDVFSIPLEKRIEYLSRAKANASTHTPGIGRTPRQALLFEISELLEVASIQDDILQRLKGDPRLAPEKRAQVLKELNGPIIGLTEVSCVDRIPLRYTI